MSVLHLTVFVLLSPQFFCDKITCPAPDFPAGGGYHPLTHDKAEYEEGFMIFYSCNGGRAPLFAEDNYIDTYKVVTCNSSGKWSEGTPFCDIPIPIQFKNTTLSVDEHTKEYTNDLRANTSFRIQNGTEATLEYSLGRRAVIYTTRACWWQGGSTFKIRVSENLSTTFNDRFGFRICTCKMSNYHNKGQETENITVLVSPDKDSSILLCEITVFAKTNEWCLHPPVNSDPNGSLQVSRSVATLHCNEGFREKDTREIYATCENNTWTYWNLQCVGENDISDHLETIQKSCDSLVGDTSPAEGEWDNDRNTSGYEAGAERTLKCRPGHHSEGTPLTVTCHENGTWTRTTAVCKINTPKKDYKLLGIIGGSLAAIIIIILIGVILFFISRKKLLRIPVISKCFGYNMHSISSVGGQSI